MPLIDPVLLKSRLAALAGRFDVDAVDLCDSTSSELSRRADGGAPAGTVFVADRQSAGRGRRGRDWVSAPEASLTFSLLWRFPGSSARLAGLSLAVGVALARALENLGAAGICLKWPNDVLLRRDDAYAKLAGILIELSADRRGTQAVIGIGLNLLPPAGELPQATAGLNQAMSEVPERHVVLAAILASLAEVLDVFAVDGFAGLKADWQQRHAWQDEAVLLLGEGEPPLAGCCLGADDDGALLLETAAGTQRIFSGDVSLRREASTPGVRPEASALGARHEASAPGVCRAASPLGGAARMIACIDCGNSRIKWGVHDGASWVGQGVLAHAEVAQLAVLCERWPMPQRLMLVNVAGSAIGAAIAQALAPWSAVLCVVKSTATGGGVTNLYNNPEQLGVDRWCALVGARRLGQTPRLVVMAGTATTIDSLDGAGNFVGGLILPGLDLMRHALAKGTAGLPFAQGQYTTMPRCTDDAIVSGIIEAQAGAIERAFSRLQADSACCLLSGGNAERIAACLVIPHLLAHNLPLEGMRHLALEE